MQNKTIRQNSQQNILGAKMPPEAALYRRDGETSGGSAFRELKATRKDLAPQDQGKEK